ncbi:MAG: hypothetical protein U9R08_01060 [Nanoarchaeota archaeon]|nr:hypothetical protein [Nanoarchaeota archaeon]
MFEVKAGSISFKDKTLEKFYIDAVDIKDIRIKKNDIVISEIDTEKGILLLIVEDKKYNISIKKECPGFPDLDEIINTREDVKETTSKNSFNYEYIKKAGEILTDKTNEINIQFYKGKHPSIITGKNGAAWLMSTI